MLTQSTFREARKQLGLGQQAMADRLGINRCYLSELENERRQPSDTLLQKLGDLLAILHSGNPNLSPRNPVGHGIPVISWARAGAASSFEEMPFDWQEVFPSDCPDESAFGLVLEGDSMEPKFLHGDIVVLMPGHRPRSNLLVGAKIRDQGVVFKMLTITANPRRFRLTSYNSSIYQPFDVREADFEWIYPAYETRRRLWR